RSDLVPDRQRSAAGRIANVNQVVGQIATRTLHRGAKIKPSDVRQAKLVKSGDLVTVTSRIGGISVQTEMKARSTGSQGESVTLETLDRRKRIQAIVTGQRLAEITTRRTPEMSGLRVLQPPTTTGINANQSETTRTSRSATRALRTTQTLQSRFQKGPRQ
ncbi:MAG: flagellar basal body P-ring formation chaperone FlgA, partial [Planctomycetaceae bacterium]